MQLLQDKIVFITGATSGIGAACAREFAKQGAKLILCARRENMLAELTDQLEKDFNAKSYCLAVDVSDRENITRAIDELPAEWSAIDILINNAGLARGLCKFHELSYDDCDEMIDTNIKGLIYVNKAVLKTMTARNSGHIIHMGSIAGHQTYPGGNIYSATKHAVRAINESIKVDLTGTNIRVSSIDPGMVETNFSNVRFRGDNDRAKQVYHGMQPLVAEDIAEIAVFIASRPAHVNILDLIVLPVAQSSTHDVHRES